MRFLRLSSILLACAVAVLGLVVLEAYEQKWRAYQCSMDELADSSAARKAGDTHGWYKGCYYCGEKKENSVFALRDKWGPDAYFKVPSWQVSFVWKKPYTVQEENWVPCTTEVEGYRRGDRL